MNDVNKMTQVFMLNIVRQLAFLDVEVMESVLAEARQSRSQADTLGPILDPTAWIAQRRDGTFEHADLQAQMVEKLIEIRRLISAADEIATRSDG